MTRRTEMVIWMVNELGFYRLRDRAAPQSAAEGNKTLRCHAKHDLMPKRGDFLAAATVRGLILTISHESRSENCTRRCWKRWCTVLAGSYLNKWKAAEMRLFQGAMVSIH